MITHKSKSSIDTASASVASGFLPLNNHTKGISRCLFDAKAQNNQHVEVLWVFKDLRDFIDHLESIGQLKRISREVDPDYEMTEVATVLYVLVARLFCSRTR